MAAWALDAGGRRWRRAALRTILFVVFVTLTP